MKLDLRDLEILKDIDIDAVKDGQDPTPEQYSAMANVGSDCIAALAHVKLRHAYGESLHDFTSAMKNER